MEEFISSPTGSTSSSSSSNKNHHNHQQQHQQHKQPQMSQNQPANSNTNRTSLDNNSTKPVHNSMHDSQLFQEYCKHKAQIVQQIEEQEKKREEYVKQLKTPNVHNALHTLQFSAGSQNNNNNNGVGGRSARGGGGGGNLNDEESFLSPRSPALHSNIGGEAQHTRNNISNTYENTSSYASRDEFMRSPGHRSNSNNNNDLVSPVSSSASSSSSHHVKSNSNSNIQQQMQQSAVAAMKPSISANLKSLNESSKFESLEVSLIQFSNIKQIFFSLNPNSLKLTIKYHAIFFVFSHLLREK